MKKIEIKNKLYITSDLHIGHSNMCLGASKWLNKKECRNFDSINENIDISQELFKSKLENSQFPEVQASYNI